MPKSLQGCLAAIATCLVMLAVVAFLDFSTGTEILVYPLYLTPVAWAAWRLGRTGGIVFAVLCGAAALGSDLLAGLRHSSDVVWAANFVVETIGLATVAVLVAEFRLRVAREQDLERTDALTALPNSRGFYEKAELLLALARRSGRAITLAYLDLDDLKGLNGKEGHEAGDRALKRVADVLEVNTRESDLVVRMGGDEFVLLLPDASGDVARVSLERMRSAVREAMTQKGWSITVTIGAVAFPRAPRTVEEAVRAADALMYRAKARGKDQVLVEEAAEPAAAS